MTILRHFRDNCALPFCEQNQLMKKLATLSLLSIALLMVSCSREADEATSLSDEALISMVKQTEAIDVSSSVVRMKAQDFRIKMNAIAQNTLSANGKMSVTYAVNSMLVKEYFDHNGLVTGYDVMYKAPADPNSSDGWLWASYDENGNPTYPVAMKGAKCNSCHNPSGAMVLGVRQ